MSITADLYLLWVLVSIQHCFGVTFTANLGMLRSMYFEQRKDRDFSINATIQTAFGLLTIRVFLCLIFLHRPPTKSEQKIHKNRSDQPNRCRFCMVKAQAHTKEKAQMSSITSPITKIFR